MSGLPLQMIFCGDNLDKLKSLPDECVDLVYLDPPFNSNRNYEVFWGEAKEKRAFEDRHESTEAYLDFMRPRCVELYRVLKRTGSFYYHCDWHACHYVKIMLDRLFGENNFLNEIIWKRTSAHGGSRRFGPVHDTILFYAKTDTFTWNPLRQSYDDRHVASKYGNQDDRGKYTADNLTGDGLRQGDSGRPWRGFDPSAIGRHWAVPRIVESLIGPSDVPLTTQEKLDLLDKNGYIYWPAKKGGFPRFKRYLAGGMMIQDVWTDIPPVNSQSLERIGYPTQKPVPLLDRIIQASSDPDDVVLDAFCGCGTALVAAQNLDRRWIGIDISPTACRVMSERLRNICGLREGRDFFVRDLPKSPEELRRYPPFEFENWAVNALNTVLVNGHAIPNRAKVGDKGIDGRIYPIGAAKAKIHGKDLFGDVDYWLPVQVKQKDKAGRPDIDLFETAMRRQGRDKGFFISFGFTSDAMREIDRVREEIDGLEIIPLTVDEIVSEERRIRL